MSSFICFYGNKRIEVQANSSYGAQQKAAEVLKVPPKKQYQITVVLAGSTVLIG